MYSTKTKEKGYKDLIKDIGAGALSPVVLLSGTEEFLIEWAANAVKAKYVNEATRIMDYQVLDESNSVDDILEAVSVFSMFSEKRVVHIRNHPVVTEQKPRGISDQEMDALIEKLKSQDDKAVIIFSCEKPAGKNKLVKAMKDFAGRYDLSGLTHEELRSFAGKRFRDAGVSIDSRRLEYLIRETGYENRESEYKLFNFDNDIRKLIDFAGNDPVTEEMISSVVTGDKDTFIFDLLDGISGNDKSRAFSIIGNRLAKDQYEAMSLIGSIASQVEIMLESREYSEKGMNPREIADLTGINEYRLKKALSYARRYPVSKLREMAESIYDVNRNIVTGVMEPRLALEMFVAGI